MAHPAGHGGEALRLLTVDDNQDMADSFALMLAAWGHDARAAYSGDQALALAAAFNPDLVFADLGMPRMDGFQFAQRLRGQPATAGVVLAAVTGYADRVHRERALREGFDLYLVKPFHLPSLRVVLDALAQAKATLHAAQAQYVALAERNRILVQRTKDLLIASRPLRAELHELLEGAGEAAE
jgi:CheY-like chemotaxis protein